MAPKRNPRSGFQPAPGEGARRPRSEVDPSTALSYVQSSPVFSFKHADRSYEGSWRWAKANEALELLDFLCAMSSSTWGEIQSQAAGGHKKHHAMAFDSVCREATQRLEALQLDQVFEEFFRFRLSGEKRLWGFRQESVFHVLWWDAGHKVYVSSKRRT